MALVVIDQAPIQAAQDCVANQDGEGAISELDKVLAALAQQTELVRAQRCLLADMFNIDRKREFEDA